MPVDVFGRIVVASFVLVTARASEAVRVHNAFVSELSRALSRLKTLKRCSPDHSENLARVLELLLVYPRALQEAQILSMYSRLFQSDARALVELLDCGDEIPTLSD